MKLPSGIALRNRILSTYRGNAKNKGHVFELTAGQTFALFAQDCFYCGAPPSRTSTHRKHRGAFTYNGIDRLDNNVGYTVDNTVPCCTECNFKKGKQHVKEFTDWVERVAKRLAEYNEEAM